jgi:hypothetical protein
VVSVPQLRPRRRSSSGTGRLREGAVVFSARSVRSNTKEVLTREYVGEVDCFLVYCSDIDEVYAIAMDEALRSTGHLRVEPPADNQHRRIRWAADHVLPRARAA